MTISETFDWSALEATKATLRNEHRLKFGVDYVWMMKYNTLHIMYSLVYYETLMEVMRADGHDVDRINWHPVS